MIDGPKVNLGGAERILAPLTLKTLKKLSPRLGELKSLSDGSLPTAEQFDLISDLVLASLHRNYPDVTVDQIDEWLDMQNIVGVLVTVLRGSGLQESKSGEAVSP